MFSSVKWASCIKWSLGTLAVFVLKELWQNLNRFNNMEMRSQGTSTNSGSDIEQVTSFIHLSVHPSFHSSIHSSLPTIRQSIHSCFHSSTHLSIHPTMFSSVHLLMNPSTVSPHPFNHPSFYLSTNPLILCKTILRLVCSQQSYLGASRHVIQIKWIFIVTFYRKYYSYAFGIILLPQ